MEEFDTNNSKHVEEIFRKFISQMQVGIKNFECAFSTTTTLTKICSQVSLAHMMKKFFSMRCICICGFPSINILGTKEDWQKIIAMLENFKNIAHSSLIEYLEKCEGVIHKFLSAYVSPEKID